MRIAIALFLGALSFAVADLVFDPLVGGTPAVLGAAIVALVAASSFAWALR